MIDGWMDGWINGWMDGLTKWSMNRWIDGLSTATPPPSSLTPLATTDHHWLYRQKYLPPSKGYLQRGLSLLRIRISCPTGILVFFGMEEFVREGGRNVDVNVYLCFTFSCELVGRLSNLKRWKFSTAHMPGHWRGGRWSEKCQLGRCMNQSWGAQARTHKQDFLAQWFADITDFFPDTTVFTIRKLALQTNKIKR